MSNIDAVTLPLHRRLPPAVLAAAAHLPALAVGAVLLSAGAPFPLTLASIGLAAGLVAWLWRLPSWWRLINLAFVPALGLALFAELSPNWYLAGLLLLSMTSLGAVVTRVPLYLSSNQAAQALAQQLPANCAFMDLGCGLGGPLAQLARLRPDVRLNGIEAAPLNWLIARVRLAGRASVRLGSLWDTNLADFDVVYAYLSPAPMARLWNKARAQMRPGSLFISNSFAVPGTPPDESIELHDLSHARLLIWRVR